MKIQKMLWFGIGLLFLYCGWLLYSNSNGEGGYIAAVVRNTVYEEKIREFEKINMVKLCEDNFTSFNAVVKGTTTLVIADRLVGLSLIKEHKRFQILQVAGDLLYYELAAVAVNRGENALRQAVNRGLTEVIDNGIYAAISERYFGRDILETWRPDQLDGDDSPARDDSWNRRERSNELRVAVSGNNPPFSYLNERGALTGFDVELAWAVSIQLGIRHFTPVMTPRDEMVKGLQTGEYDLIWDGVRVNDNPVVLDFSTPYYRTGAQLFVKKGSPISGPEILGPPVLPDPPPVTVLTPK